MAASPATLDRSTAAPAGSGGGAVVRPDRVRDRACTPSRPAGAPANGLRAAMARGAILLQSGLESPDVLNVDISVGSDRIRAAHVADATAPRPMRRRSRRYAARRMACG